ncbi:MAG: hypothetical protein H0W62_05345 [Chitinophagales bacterium]|nr:hypothetical protein [Chitinophagales bacterium]
MENSSKIWLSAGEIDMLGQRDFFLTKKIIIEKIYHQFAILIEETKRQAIFINATFPEGSDSSTGKISKGENYMGFPYQILDFPRFFSGENILAIRTMVWWGNFCSCTLLLSGNSLLQHAFNLRKSFLKLKENDFYVSVSDSPWHHHFNRENFIAINELSEETWIRIIDKNIFIKIARKIPIDRINELVTFSINSFRIFAALLTSH